VVGEVGVVVVVVGGGREESPEAESRARVRLVKRVSAMAVRAL